MELFGSNWILSVNGKHVGEVTFHEGGDVTGMSEFPGHTGFLLHGPEEHSHRFFRGLYVWTDERHAVHVRDAGREAVREGDQLMLWINGLRTGVTASIDEQGLPGHWSEGGLCTEAWCNRFELCEAPFLKLRLDDSTVGFHAVSRDVLLSVGEEEWYPCEAPRPCRQVVLMREARHRSVHLAAKYDLWGFRDKLGYEAAARYARKAVGGAAERLGRMRVLDFGSGSMEAGPFSDSAFRRSVSRLWKAVDVSSRHYSANCLFRAQDNEDVFPSQADLVASQEGAVDCDLVVAKDSLNNLVWSDLCSLLRGLRSAGVVYLLTNGSPGFDNDKRMAEECCFDGDVWRYRRFDPAGKGLSLETMALFEADGEEEHVGTWGLYLL